jgi:Zn-dependent peptidase ImmA (M78 family)
MYHLIENASVIKENTVVEESETLSKEVSEMTADIFAAELLMPEVDISKEYKRLMKISCLKNPDEALIINLQQDYFVEYKAITKRLAELNIINDKTEEKLNKIIVKENELFKLTQKLGYSNQINKSTRKVYLPKELLKAIEVNYKNGNTTFDDLIVLFGYCDLSPYHFGYEEEELTADAKALMEKIKAQLGSESIGEK